MQDALLVCSKDKIYNSELRFYKMEYQSVDLNLLFKLYLILILILAENKNKTINLLKSSFEVKKKLHKILAWEPSIVWELNFLYKRQLNLKQINKRVRKL